MNSSFPHSQQIAAHPQAPESEFCLRGTTQFDLTSATGRKYRILMSIPDLPPTERGYPIIYTLDGHAIFAPLLAAERAQSRRTQKTDVIASIIIGIGYPSELPNSPERHYDYTLPVPAEHLPPSRDGQPWALHGGADEFLRFIQEVLKPEVERRQLVDVDRQTLLGHSFGGLFTLHTLFTAPQSFRNYVAASPSLHWGQPLIAEEEQIFTEYIKNANEEHHLFIALGALENTPPFHMLQHAAALAERLQPLHEYGLHVRFREYADENHGSVVPSMISAALRTAAL
ncbi:alpha/beta hydrolase [Paenibacillus kandeliae]|uniref:alpha/beta hydrolase n=1 Tax=Paenibacillus kandeliae TaxID=3231269 RepID=UPI00345A5BFF